MAHPNIIDVIHEPENSKLSVRIKFRMYPVLRAVIIAVLTQYLHEVRLKSLQRQENSEEHTHYNKNEIQLIMLSFTSE